MGQQERSSDGDDLRLSAFVAELDGIEPPTDAPTAGTCRICGVDGPGYDAGEVFSNSFTSANQLESGDLICYRCEYLATEMDYRRYHWIATEDGMEMTKERPDLLETLLDPPTGRWMLKAADGFLRVPNAWIKAQRVNVSQDHFSVLDDTTPVDIDRDEFTEIVEFARSLRDRDDQVAKRVLTGGANAADYDRYSLARQEVNRIDQYRGRADWELAVRLIQ